MNDLIQPNEYDLAVTGNGCGNKALKRFLGKGIDTDFIFAEACKWHDFHYSKYSYVTKYDADEMFYIMMIRSIEEGKYNKLKELWYTGLAKLYYQLVDSFGKDSYDKFNDSIKLPSFTHEKSSKLRDSKIKTVWVESYRRWYTQKEIYRS